MYCVCENIDALPDISYRVNSDQPLLLKLNEHDECLISPPCAALDHGSIDGIQGSGGAVYRWLRVAKLKSFGRLYLTWRNVLLVEDVKGNRFHGSFCRRLGSHRPENNSSDGVECLGLGFSGYNYDSLDKRITYATSIVGYTTGEKR